MTPFERLVNIMATLRAEHGCPWDRQQTHESIRPYLIEEAYEVLDAIDQRDDTRFREELGDLLLQIVFHAQMAREGGRFTIDDLITTVVEKLIRRHPHVFGSVEAKTADQVLINWEKIKHTEGGQQRKSVLEGLPNHLPALLKAYRVQEKVARVGFDWSAVDDVFKKVQEEITEFRDAYAVWDRERLEDEFGDLLFSLVNLARHIRISPEDALRRTIQRFVDRFQYIEETLRLNGESLDNASLERMDALWEEAKRREEERGEKG
ncbi:MAG: nucleoside triphosphate pyrophosphohydrolase [Candidatus Latescibacteria bacterium]|nr:nucleoside triphosphate pyrophosphohydrolase [Candidatus Latescibacterota bacterium]